MARVTIEDCEHKVHNRFKLVILAAQRVKHLLAGADLTVERDNDKNTVVALREIAQGTIDLQNLENAVLKNLASQSVQESAALFENHNNEVKSMNDLSLTGEFDSTEADLAAEFKKIEEKLTNSSQENNNI